MEADQQPAAPASSPGDWGGPPDLPPGLAGGASGGGGTPHEGGGPLPPHGPDRQASSVAQPGSHTAGLAANPAEDARAGVPPRSARAPFWTYGDVLLFCGLAVPSSFLAWGLVKGIFLALRVHHAAPAVEPLAEQFVLYVMLFGGLRLIFRVEYGQPFWRSLAWEDLRIPFLWIVVAGAVCALAVAFLGEAIHTPNTKNAITELMEDRVSLVLMTVFGVTLGPLCEELAFRGFLQPLLVRSFGPIPGVLLAAVPFGLLHYQEYGNSWRHAVIVAAAGAAFGWMRQATGSTKASALMHASYNALFFVAAASQNGALGR